MNEIRGIRWKVSNFNLIQSSGAQWACACLLRLKLLEATERDFCGLKLVAPPCEVNGKSRLLFNERFGRVSLYKNSLGAASASRLFFEMAVGRRGASALIGQFFRWLRLFSHWIVQVFSSPLTSNENRDGVFPPLLHFILRAESRACTLRGAIRVGCSGSLGV